MNLSREEFEALITQLATRVELGGLKLTVDEIKERLEEINKRNLDDGNFFSTILLTHEDRIKKLEEMAARI